MSNQEKQELMKTGAIEAAKNMDKGGIIKVLKDQTLDKKELLQLFEKLAEEPDSQLREKIASIVDQLSWTGNNGPQTIKEALERSGLYI